MHCDKCENLVNKKDKYCTQCGRLIVKEKKSNDNKKNLKRAISFLIITFISGALPFGVELAYGITILIYMFTFGLFASENGKDFKNEVTNIWKYINYSNPIYDILIFIFAIITIVYFVKYFKIKKQEKEKLYDR